MNPKLTRKMLVTIVLAVILVPYLIAQDKHDKACNGLHAAIGGEVVRRDPPDTQPPFVMLTFVLLNDSEASIDTAGSFQFGKGLELSRYFPDEREYKVAWKGKGEFYDTRQKSKEVIVALTPCSTDGFWSSVGAFKTPQRSAFQNEGLLSVLPSRNFERPRLIAFRRLGHVRIHVFRKTHGMRPGTPSSLFSPALPLPWLA